MFDKTSGDKEVYDVEKRTEENGLTMIYAISRRTKSYYKFTIIDKKVSVFYDYDKGTVRWSNKSGHKLNLTLCSYGKEDCKKTAA